MSKVSQRKRQAYREGHMDAIQQNGIRYSKHPFMEHYKRGYHDGWQARQLSKNLRVKHVRWYNRLLAWLAARLAA